MRLERIMLVTAGDHKHAYRAIDNVTGGIIVAP
jgi:hypothetical protein